MLNKYIRTFSMYFQGTVWYIKAYGIKMFLRKLRHEAKLILSSFFERGNEARRKLISFYEDEEASFFDDIVSVIIPTKNAGSEFEQILYMIRSQKGIKDIEIIIVDSGSSDSTLEISKRYKAKIIQIPPEKFTHSYSRNLGAENTEGNYILFMTQDACPPNDTWIYELLSALENTGSVAVSCAEFQRSDSDLFYRVISWRHSRILGIDSNDRILKKPVIEDVTSLRKNGQLSDVACLIMKDVFLKYKHRTNYAEDLDLGIRLVRDGFKLVLVSSAKVIHSHNRDAYYYLKREFVETFFLKDIFKNFDILPIEFSSLRFEIINTYCLINYVVDDKISTIELPCKFDEFYNSITKIINSEYTYEIFKNYGINYQNKNYNDENLLAFIKKIMELNSVAVDTSSNKGLLIAKLRYSICLILEYMKGCYEEIDEHMLEDFKASIYKFFASSCGRFLSSCYIAGTDEDKDMLKEVYHELFKGV